MLAADHLAWSAEPNRREKYMKPQPGAVALRYALILLATAIVLYPLLWMVSMAFKPYQEWTSVAGLSWLPKNPTLQNFEFLLFGKAEGLVVTLDRTLAGPLISSLVTSSVALLHKSPECQSSPFPGRTYPLASVTGVPSAVKPFRTATRTWNSAT